MEVRQKSLTLNLYSMAKKYPILKSMMNYSKGLQDTCLGSQKRQWDIYSVVCITVNTDYMSMQAE